MFPMKSEIQRAQSSFSKKRQSIQYYGFAEHSAFIDKEKKRNQLHQKFTFVNTEDELGPSSTVV